VAGGATLFEALLYLEELWRDLKAHPGRLEPPAPRGTAGPIAELAVRDGLGRSLRASYPFSRLVDARP
jgi:hypothetical protein